MKKISKQMINGKAFEYAILNAFWERLKDITNVKIIENAPYISAKKSYDTIDETSQMQDGLSASFAVNFLIDIEPKLSNDLGKDDILQLEIKPDHAGEQGDVRDVLSIRALQRWEIGVSAKNNHRAVKHSRLSNDIDFGAKWIGIPCSEEYFSSIKPIFDMLADLRKKSQATQTWHSLGDYHTSVYIPILEAFKNELSRLDKDNPGVIAPKLVEYLIGNKDFYKIIKGNNKVEIQAYNLHETLNTSFQKIKPKAKIQKLKLPTRLIEIVYKDDSKTTLLVTLNEGWQISFRIHNASSRIESSLKFDINLVSAPHTLFTNQLILPAI